jgi:cytochrome c oxidase subunit 2
MVVLMFRLLTLTLAFLWLPQTAPTAPRNTAAQARTQTVDIAAERFSFTPSQIKTVVGTTLEIKLTSDDTAHGFRIVGTDVNVEIPKRSRGVATVTFTPQSAGRLLFECSQLCGAGHSFMRGEIIVSDADSGR